MSRKNILIILVIVAIVGGIAGYRYIGNSNDSSYELVEVQRGELVQEISASGKVESPTKADLRFKNSGKLTILSAEVGEKVTTGQLLAKQDTSVLDAQLLEIQADIEIRKAQLAIAEADAVNMESTLLDTIRNAYIKADDAVSNQADKLFRNPRSSPSLGITFRDGNTAYLIDTPNYALRSSISTSRGKVSDALDTWPIVKTGGSSRGLNYDAEVVQANLAVIEKMLGNIGLAINDLSASDSTANDVYNSFKNSISSARISVSEALSSVTTAKNNLISAGLQSDLYQAQIRQAEAQMQKIQAQRQEMIITAPSAGIVTQTNGEVGEIAAPDMIIVSLTPSGNLQIKVNISEADVVSVSVGQEARITLDAFDNSAEWKGRVVSIDPAETIIGGAVYYQTTVLFDKEDKRIRSGMTANVWIKASHKENVFFVPAKAIKEKEGKKFIEILAGSRVQEKEVQTGMKGENGTIEIISGLSEGEKVIVGNKKQ